MLFLSSKSLCVRRSGIDIPRDKMILPPLHHHPRHLPLPLPTTLPTPPSITTAITTTPSPPSPPPPPPPPPPPNHHHTHTYSCVIRTFQAFQGVVSVCMCVCGVEGACTVQVKSVDTWETVSTLLTGTVHYQINCICIALFTRKHVTGGFTYAHRTAPHYRLSITYLV